MGYTTPHPTPPIKFSVQSPPDDPSESENVFLVELPRTPVPTIGPENGEGTGPIPPSYRLSRPDETYFHCSRRVPSTRPRLPLLEVGEGLLGHKTFFVTGPSKLLSGQVLHRNFTKELVLYWGGDLWTSISCRINDTLHPLPPTSRKPQSDLGPLRVSMTPLYPKGRPTLVLKFVEEGWGFRIFFSQGSSDFPDLRLWTL